MQQLEFPSPRRAPIRRSLCEGGTQADRILARLQQSPGQWVPMPELARIGSGSETGFCMVHSRIADLRKRGLTIEHTSERKDAKCHSFYRLSNVKLTP